MRDLRGRAPSGELDFIMIIILFTRGNQFDGGLLRLLTLMEFGEKYCAVFRAAKISKQGIFPLDNLALPLFPIVGHD